MATVRTTRTDPCTGAGVPAADGLPDGAVDDVLAVAAEVLGAAEVLTDVAAEAVLEVVVDFAVRVPLEEAAFGCGVVTGGPGDPAPG